MKTLPPSRPPAFWRALLALGYGPEERADLARDLDEEFSRHVLPEHGTRAARRWYRRQVTRSLGVVLRQRLRLRPDRPRPSSPRHDFVATLLQDLRFALRGLRARPLPGLAAILTLALGIGATTAVFSAVNAVLLQPLPWGEPGRLVRIWPEQLFYTGLADALDFRDRVAPQLQTTAYGRTLATLTGGSEAEVVRGAIVSADHFDVLQTRPAFGRGFRAQDALPGAERVVILSHALWLRRLGGDPATIDTAVDISGVSHRLIGVMGPDHLALELDWEIWFPIEEADDGRHADFALALVARTAAGVSLERAAEISRQAFADRSRDTGGQADPAQLAEIGVAPLASWLIGDTAPRVRLLAGAVALVLLIAVANVANLLLAQGQSRQRELTVRAALGAGRGRLLRQSLTESAALGAIGGTLGVLLAAAVLAALVPVIPAAIPRAGSIAIDRTVLAFTALTSVGAALLAGVVPAWRAGKMEGDGLRESAGAGIGRRPLATVQALVVAEVALCVLLVVAAGLTLRSLWALQSVDPGFRTQDIVALRVHPPAARYPDGADVVAYHEAVRAGIAALPVTRSVGGIMFLPMRPGGWTARYRAPEQPVVEGIDPETTSMRMVAPGYFETMEIGLLGGRMLTAADAASEANVALVNRELARRVWGAGADPVGREVVLGDAIHLVVGMVADVRQRDLRAASGPEAYVPHRSAAWRNLYFVVRAEGAGALDRVRDAVRSVDPQVPLTDVAALDHVVGATIADSKLLGRVLAGFAGLALGLGLVGVYGVTAYGVSQRRREIAIRLALGADARRIQRETLARGLRPVLAGLVVGWVAATIASRLVSSALYDVDPLDPATFAVVPALVLAASVAALLLPARRASAADPSAVLRES